MFAGLLFHKIEPFQTYFPDTEMLSATQRRTYNFIKKNLAHNKYVDVESNVSYLFLYVYETLETVKKTKHIPAVINKLEQVVQLYKSDNDKFCSYVEYWIAGLYCVLEDYEKALDIYAKDLCILNTNTARANTICSIKGYLGIDVTARDIISLLDRKFTDLVKDKIDKIECFCDLVLKQEKERLGMDYIQYINKKYPNEAKYDLQIFSGLRYGWDLLRMNPNLIKEIAYYAIPEVYNFCITLTRNAENLLREYMDVPKVGEGWISETELYYKIKEYFPNLEVIHQYRDKWLGKQHLDIFIPTLKLAFEYQGVQHTKPVDFFGGVQGFVANKKRDYIKKQKCTKNGVLLYEVFPDYKFDDIKQFILNVLAQSSV